MQESKSLSEILLEQLEQKSLDVEKLSASTGIPERFINAFLNPNYTDHQTLPSAPYIRSYLKKISLVLDLNPETTWTIYDSTHPPRQSGKLDNLPQNRFAIHSVNKKNVAIVFISGLALIYIIFNASRLLSRPSISISEPAAETTTLTTPSFYIKGVVENPKDILTINGASVYINESGEFNKEFSLTLGANSFEIILKRFLGRENHILKQIIYEPTTNSIQPQR